MSLPRICAVQGQLLRPDILCIQIRRCITEHSWTSEGSHRAEDWGGPQHAAAGGAHEWLQRGCFNGAQSAVQLPLLHLHRQPKKVL